MRAPLLYLSTASGTLAPVKMLLPLLMAQLWAAQALLLPGNDTRVALEASGVRCTRDSQPWQVSLFHNLQFQCAGVLVDRSWVLTAAHCWRKKTLRARIGDDHLLLFQKEQLRSTNSPVFHPKYQPCSGPVLPHRSDEHDLMLLKLSSPVVLTPSVHPVQLPFRFYQPAGSDPCVLHHTSGHCGADTRAVGARECQHHSQPWQAGLFYFTRQLCGATLISDRWLLTAAHCRKPYLWVRLGEHHLWQWEGPEKLYLARDFFPHPGFNSDLSANDHNDDIMLIRLPRKVQMSAAVQPLNLSQSLPTVGSQCLISGWGSVSSSK
ncbi:hypothetical protein STEG23_026313, partial [Scotinomys teguina]